MRAKVLFFGVLRDFTGRSADEAEFPHGADMQWLFEAYASRFPALREMAGSIVMARNREFAALTVPIEDGDEIAFLPPVSGGSDRPLEMTVNGSYFALARRPLDLGPVRARLLTGSEGAVVTFEGTVRNNTAGKRTRFLEYEAYEPMALAAMSKIGASLQERHAIGRIAMVHRLGRMLVGETSVAIIVTAPHRPAAFDAAREAIDLLKKSVPIWKKEHFVDGAVWVEGEWDESVPVVQR
jgi:molybdopterin synthase catalytic subunit